MILDKQQKKSLQNQNVIGLKDTLLIDPYYSRHDDDLGRGGNPIGLVVMMCFGVAMGVVLLAAIQSCERHNNPVAVKKECTSCHNRTMAMESYFERKGNPTPQKMAAAVLATSNPKLLAAVAVAGEKNTHYAVRKGGYKKRHAGAWQVNPKFWGPVPTSANEQAKQAEAILKELTTDYGLKKGLSIYGGDSTDAYQRRVLLALQEVP